MPPKLVPAHFLAISTLAKAVLALGGGSSQDGISIYRPQDFNSS